MKTEESSITYKGSGAEDISTTWTYEMINGKKILKSVDIHYPKGHKHADTDKIFINPETGKVISKARAKQLGVYKSQM